MNEPIVEWIGQAGYGTIYLLMLIETVFPPIPSELIMSLAGVRAASGSLSLPLVIVAGTAGAMTGNLFWYGLARWLGLERFQTFVRRFGRVLTLDWQSVERADDFFDRYAAWFVCLGRMVPTIRSLVSIPAGLFGMRLLPFLIWSTLGSLGWTSALAIAGYQLGKRAPDVDRYLAPVSLGVVALLAGWYVVRLVTWKPR
ncbi:DedA family protein [Sphingomonas naphthae]|uniref:DedA family protein n=1 Tax=Sphingomonas naphthae TaxID=1813468 RepID=A0ABY7TTT6_9SPHN|nr:DedA family protein [Sphingomonas naphthae]WCT75279.1 DedA family protein [Sphingomonas naphthae]